MRCSLGLAGLLLLLAVVATRATATGPRQQDDVLHRVNATLTYAEQVRNALLLSWLRDSGILALYAKSYNLTSLPGLKPASGSGKVHAAGLLGGIPPPPQLQLPPLPPLLLPKLLPPPPLLNLSKLNISKPPKLDFSKLQLPKPLPPLFKPLPPFPGLKPINSTGLDTLKAALLLAWLKETGVYDKLVALNKSTEEMNTLLNIAAKQVDRKFADTVEGLLTPSKALQVVRAAAVPADQQPQAAAPRGVVAGNSGSPFAAGVEGPDADEVESVVASVAPAAYAPAPTYTAAAPAAAARTAAPAAAAVAPPSSATAALGPCFKVPNGKARQACFNTFVVRMQIATKAVTCAGVPPADVQECINKYVTSMQRRQAASSGGSSSGPQSCEDLATPRRQGCINAWINEQMKRALARGHSAPRPSVPRPVPTN